MSKHTPAPWRVTGGTNVFAGNRRPIANCAVYSTNGPDWEKVIEENEANAKLTAAAPELLEALTNLLAYAERQADYPPGAVREPMAVKQARAALASVEGGAK